MAWLQALDLSERLQLARMEALDTLRPPPPESHSRPASVPFLVFGSERPTTLEHSRRGARSGCACDAKRTVLEAGRKY